FEILADAGGFSRWDQVERARVVFHNNQTSTLEPVPGEPLVFHGRKALKPGDYDFRVELYGATLYAADRLYQSPWESVRIHPGKTSRVTWEAAAGIAHLELVISPMPDPPRDLRLERESAGAALAWSPSADPRVHAYRVYVKDDEFGPFSLRGEVPAPQTSWPVPEAVLERGGWAAVTALTDQREGFRSEVPRIPPLAAAEPGAPWAGAGRGAAHRWSAAPRLTATCLPYRRESRRPSSRTAGPAGGGIRPRRAHRAPGAP